MLKNVTPLFYTYRRCFFVLLMLNIVLHSQAQTTIAQWNFNNSTTAPSTGTGTLALIGGVTATYAAGAGADPGNPNNGLNTSDYPVQGTNAKTAGIAITVNTTGYNYIHLKYYVQHSSTAAKKVTVQYFDGTAWQDASSYIVANAGSFLPQMDIDLSAYPDVNNKAAAQIRLVIDFSNGNLYEPVNSTNYNAGSGTIRYDLVTITGSTLACVGPATIQAAGLRLLKTDATSAQLTLNRGNGGGCLVVCSSSGIPPGPVNNTAYTANSFLGNGAAIGNGFAVYNTQVNNPAIQYFNITNLTAGTKYYVAAYEYSSSGNCYLPTAFVDSFYCNSTVLYPGDVQFVGYDNNVASGKDAFVIMNLKQLNTGTSFQIVNSRYEAGAPANTRTNRWYAGGDAIHQNLQQITITYTGVSLPAGSVISFNHEAQNPGNIKINGIITTDLSVTDNLTISNLLSGSGAEQFFLTQGRFTAYGSIAANNQYSILDGHVLHGISYTNPWVAFNQSCDSTTTRQSRIPPDIKCINLFVNGSANFAYYPSGTTHSGSQNFLLSQINNVSNWSFGSGTSGDDIATIYNAPFTITGNIPNGTWTGAANGNWFNCNNWEGRFVPDSTTDVIIQSSGFSPSVNANALFVSEYNRVATTHALTIGNGILSMNGTAPNKFIVYDSLLVNTDGSFSSFGGSDTIILRGNLQRRDVGGIAAFANSYINIDGNRLLLPIYIWLITGSGFYNVKTLAINNLPGVQLLNGDIETVQQLELTNGILSVIEGQATIYLSQNCNIVSPANLFGENNRGWEKSFIDGRVNIRTDNLTDTLTAPVGSAAKNIFAPMVFETNNDINGPISRIYSARYMPDTTTLAPPTNFANPPLDHVSNLEYWTLNSVVRNAIILPAAKVTLYYTPYSRVGGSGNADTALLNLRIAQYWDSLAPGGEKWRLYGLNGNYTVTGNVNRGKIRYNQDATDLSLRWGYFTLATTSPYNALPVQLITWKAALQAKRVQLNWQVADENDIRFYTIEKSTNGRQYTGLQMVQQWGSGTNHLYTCYDDQPAIGWNYYRLKVTGTDGKTFYSAVQKVAYASAVQWLVYPNPATDAVWLQLPAAGVVTMYAIDGRMVLQRRLPASLHKLNLPSFAKGMYVVEYFDGRKKWSEKISLQ